MSWQIVPTRLLELLGDPDREKSQRVMQAMLSMGKIEHRRSRASGGRGVGSPPYRLVERERGDVLRREPPLRP